MRCCLKSKGSSIMKCNKQKGSSNKYQLKKHNITTHIGGIGGGSLNLSISGSGPSVGGGFTFGGKDASKDYNTANVYYSTDASIWRLYEYSETHSGHYIIKNSKNANLCTIEVSCRVSY